MSKRASILILFALALVLTASSAAAQPFTVVGSWQGLLVNEAVPFESPVLLTFNRGGTVVATTRNPDFGTGHGVWRRSGLKKVTATFTAFSEDPAGPVSTVQTDLEITLDRHGEAFDAEVVFQIFVDGVLVDVSPGQGRALRLRN